MFSIFTNFPKPNQNLHSFLYFSSQIQICTSILRNDASLVQKGSSVKRASAELSAVSAVCVALNLPSWNFHPLPVTGSQSSTVWESWIHCPHHIWVVALKGVFWQLRWKSLGKFGLQSAGGCPHSLPQWVNSCDVVPPVPFTGQWLIQLIQFSVDKLMNIPDHISV